MSSSPIALVTGAGGQDGTLLTNELSSRDWEVIAVHSPGSSRDGFRDIPGRRDVVVDLADFDAARTLLRTHRPTHVFHLAAVSSVAASWEDPIGTSHINAMLPAVLMNECLALAEEGTEVRFVNASSGEIFAGSAVTPQSETTRINPTSPYGVAKAFAFTMARTLRSSGLWAANAILYNHESTIRAPKFVTRKITQGVASIARGQSDTLTLGNLDTYRDWGWAPDYVDAMIRIATHDTPDDFVIATGKAHSVRDFVAAAFSAAGISDWESHVTTSDKFARPTDAAVLVGDASHAELVIGWKPTMTFPAIVEAMVQHDLLTIEENH